MKELTNERVAEALGFEKHKSEPWWHSPQYTYYYWIALPDWLHSNELAVRDCLRGTNDYSIEYCAGMYHCQFLTDKGWVSGEGDSLALAICSAYVEAF